MHDDGRTIFNDYVGGMDYHIIRVTFLTLLTGATQQTTSGLSVTDQSCYERATACFTTYGFEYKPGYRHITSFSSSRSHSIYSFDDSYITWINAGTPAWTLTGAGMGADQIVEIGARPVSQEPMVSYQASYTPLSI